MPRPKSAAQRPMRNLTGTPEYQCPRCTDKHGLQAGWHPIENFPRGSNGQSLLNCKECHRPNKRRDHSSESDRPKSAAQKLGIDVQDFLYPRRHKARVMPNERDGEQFAELLPSARWVPHNE